MKINPPVTSFDPNTKSVIIGGFGNVPKGECVLMVTNVTRGVIVHNVFDPNKIASFTGPSYDGQEYSITATLPSGISTSGMLSTDKFHVVYDPENVGTGGAILPQVQISGKTASGNITSVPLSVSNGGILVDLSGSSAGPLPSGAATSANQATANSSLSNIDTDIGATADSAASTDTGTFSLISLFKRLLSTKLPDQSSGRIPVSLASTGTTGATAPTTANLFAGTDGTNLRAISTDSSGRANVNINGTVPVSGTFWPATQPISGTVGLTASNLNNNTLPSEMHLARSVGELSESAATSDTESRSIISLFRRLLQRITALIPANLTVTSTRLLVDGSGVTQPISGTVTANNSALIARSGGPVSDSTQNIQVIGGRSAGAAGSSLYAPASIDGNGGLQVGVKWIDTNSGNQPRDPSQQTPFPVQIISATSLPLPSGAATSASQSTANTSLASIDANVGATSESAATTDTGTFSLISLFKRLLSTKLPDQSNGRIPVTLASAGTTGSTAPTTANLYAGTDGTNLRAISTDSSGRINTNVNGTVTANVTAPSGSITTRSSTITTGGTSQQVATSNTSRKYFAIQNISDTDMYLGVGYTPTTTTGILLTKSGGGFVFESNFIPTQAINILCATTGKAFVAWEG